MIIFYVDNSVSGQKDNMLTVNWFLQECTRLESCTLGIRIHVYDQNRLNSFHSWHDPLTKQDVLTVFTSEFYTTAAEYLRSV